MFEQDPFDRWCLAVFSELQYVARSISLRCAYVVGLIGLQIRHCYTILLIKTKYLCLRVFGTSFGIRINTLTWSEIEQLRRQFIRETGVFYPRSQQLEEGLEREREEEHKS